MSEILSLIITGVLSALTTGGIGSIFYFKQNRKLKDAEVKAADADIKTVEISNLSSSNEEWIKLYNNALEEKNRLKEIIRETSDKLDAAYQSKDTAWAKYSDCRQECNKKDLIISDLNWYRCEINACPYRKPPRRYGDMDFPKNGISPIEHPDLNAL